MTEAYKVSSYITAALPPADHIALFSSQLRFENTLLRSNSSMSRETVFITGATGFVGSHTLNYTLKAGYRVKLSIRRKEQEQDIKSWLQGAHEDVEFCHIPDLTKPGVFVEALRDVDYIFHLASPLPGKGEDVEKDYVQPAVDGTLAILEEALQHERIKFVIVTSSILALLPMGAIARPPVHPEGKWPCLLRLTSTC